jgi:hypothetical protein
MITANSTGQQQSFGNAFISETKDPFPKNQGSITNLRRSLSFHDLSSPQGIPSHIDVSCWPISFDDDEMASEVSNMCDRTADTADSLLYTDDLSSSNHRDPGKCRTNEENYVDVPSRAELGYESCHPTSCTAIVKYSGCHQHLRQGPSSNQYHPAYDDACSVGASCSTSQHTLPHWSST